VLAEVTGFDLDNRLVLLGPIAREPSPDAIPYDTLIVSGGAHHTYGQHTTAQPGRQTKSGHPDGGRYPIAFWAMASGLIDNEELW
jgi:hypothetical protein